MILVKVENIEKKYGDRRILKNISLELEMGKIIALLGPNGSGKSTLFRCLSGLSQIDHGKINVNADKITKQNGIIYVFDEPILYETLTAEEHLRFIMDINKISSSRQEINEALEKFDLLACRDKIILDYSLGMKKRVQLMCAMITSPTVILLDEYISGLDPISLKRVQEILREYVLQGNTVLLATHIIDVAERFCDSVYFIQDGEIAQTHQEMKDIKHKYNSLEEYYFKMAAKGRNLMKM